LFFPDAAEAATTSHELESIMAEAFSESRETYRPNIAAYNAPQMADVPVPAAAQTPLEDLSIFSGKDDFRIYTL
jgi:protein AFG1